jgi:hypothetical protein
MLLAVTLLNPTLAQATPKPLDPGTVHVRLLKRGIGNWVALQENNGVQLAGRIIAISDHSFALQLHNDPQTTEIDYTDVAYLQTGIGTSGKVLLGVGLALVAGSATYGIIHANNLSNKPLVPPTPPALP